MTDLGDPTWPIAAARAADDKQATDPVVLAVGDVLAVTDHFVIASAPNSRLVKAIVEEIESQLKDADGPRPIRTEGLDDLEWVLVDYGPFVVHVFSDKTRAYYDLERLWRDVPTVEWELAGTPSGDPSR
ncbi:MAG TPA: ribosome silencing factor [Acidimicrobiales bacterium]|nr:ribosome silencing factor [Acidimicrobiales bacterium]